MRRQQAINNEIENTYKELEIVIGIENSELEKSLKQRLKNLQEEAAALIKLKKKNMAITRQGLEILEILRKKRIQKPV
ncbi:MAG: hypothetical protein A3J54_01730 [Candidatus Ryanbacteria bacterium RIFCSPHIGHO2_02_FULL_45_13b]|uniref:Uncharacterized protein n=1 Tax=Candidatus Ryanbacteria bacterium RIFCSPHIGHO2_02_FULL_45_13b TaxID=1802117 RepID=A0A1G2G9W3_9BACT|nr:MAG: hypothetical protein A3J54_01730 [Candidatus Ryanbacteria bacterium RIFCSPHIGHO2_02_FULL_45_13b]